jgi:flagellin-specific chaperone FliS
MASSRIQMNIRKRCRARESVGSSSLIVVSARLLVTTAMTILSMSSLPHSSVGDFGMGVAALQSSRWSAKGQLRKSHFWKSSLILSLSSRSFDSGSRDENDGTADHNDDGSKAFSTASQTSSMTKASTLEVDNQDLLSLQAQAAKLREEAKSLQLALQQEKQDKIQRETEKVDRWIEELLIEAKVSENTELLKTVDQVLERLTEDRYSAEQVNKIFKRLCDIRTQESRSNCSPLMSLLVDAAGKLDCTEREDNPNKRWNHKVERVLQKKLFARDWNIELEDEEDDTGNPWKLR